MSNFRLMVLFSVAETDAGLTSPGLVARFRAELSNDTPMAPSRIGAILSASAAALFLVAWTVALTFRVGPVTTQAVLEDMLLRSGEVQYGLPTCRSTTLR